MPENDQPPVHSAPGFRCSIVDGLVILGTTIASILLWGVLGTFALLFPIVLIHFFLFCNVFRVRRSLELVWAGIFVINFAAGSLRGDFAWWPILLIQTPVTIACIGIEMRSPRYHGIGYSHIRRQTPEVGKT